MEDSISNPGIPLSRDFVPVSSSGGPGASEQRLASPRVTVLPPGPQRPGATAAVDPPGIAPTPKTRDDKTVPGVADSVAFANAIAAFLDTQVSFTYDKRIEQIVVKVTKGDSEEIIRQIPSEEMIKMVVQLRQDFRGLIFNRTG